MLKIHRPYHESDHVVNTALNLLVGGECLEHLELLGSDWDFLDMDGARRTTSPTTAGDFCRRLDCAEFVEALQTAINEARLRVRQT